MFYFSEEKYMKDRPDEFDDERKDLLRQMPEVKNIYEFMKALYECAQYSPECCIICLVYINRLIAFTGMPLEPTNWRPLILCSLLVAQKVWDDKYLSNADFAYIYPFFKIEEINQLEQKFLELIQYHVTVKSTLYAKYYFELRALFKDASEFPLQPLDAMTASALEARSKEVGSWKPKWSYGYFLRQASRPNQTRCHLQLITRRRRVGPQRSSAESDN